MLSCTRDDCPIIVIRAQFYSLRVFRFIEHTRVLVCQLKLYRGLTDTTCHHRSLKELVRQLAKNGPVKAMHTPKRIRLLFGGAFIADTAAAASALYIWEHEYYPQFYLPMEAFVAPKGFDVNLTHGEAITDEKGKVVGGGLEIAVRRKGTNDEYKVLNEMAVFAADLEGSARLLRNIVKVNFSSVGKCHLPFLFGS